MAAPKRTETEREADLVRIAKLHRKGCSERRIATILRLSPAQVHYDLVEIRKRYAEQTIHVREMHVNEIDAQLNDLMYEHWRCYKKLQRDSTKMVETQTVVIPRDDKGEPAGPPALRTTEVKTTIMERVPGAEHLRAIHDILKSKRELFGVDAPRKIDVRRLTIDMEQLIKQMEDAPEPLTVEEELEQLLKQLPSSPDSANQISPSPGNGNGRHDAGDDLHR